MSTPSNNANLTEKLCEYLHSDVIHLVQILKSPYLVISVRNIANIKSIDDLNCILSHSDISLQYIQNIVTEQIHKLDDSVIRTVYYTLPSILYIFPDDITQYILSFNFAPNMETISKSIKLLSDKNKEMMMKQRNEAIDLETFNVKISFDPSFNKTHVIERNNLIEGRVNHIQNMIDECNSGDKILIYDGEYELKTDMELSFDITIDIIKNIQLIGVGNNVKLKDFTNYLAFMNIGGTHTHCNVYIENITFDCTQSVERYCVMNVYGHSKLSLKHCKFQMKNCGIIAARNSSLDVKECEFIGGASGIEISPFCTNSNIVGCSFVNQGNETEFYKESESACICIPHSYDHISFGIDIDDIQSDDMSIYDNLSNIKLRCIANIFSNNLCYPIAKVAEPGGTDHEEFVVRSKQYVLEHNILSGCNVLPRNRNIKIETANKVYYNDEVCY